MTIWHVFLIMYVAETNSDGAEPKRREVPAAPTDHLAYAPVRQLFLQLDCWSPEDYQKLDKRGRDLWDLMRFEGGVTNGGINAYLWNSVGDNWKSCLPALKRIGSTKSWNLLHNACMLFPKECPSPDTATRRDQIREILANSDETLDDRVEGEVELIYYQKVLTGWQS